MGNVVWRLRVCKFVVLVFNYSSVYSDVMCISTSSGDQGIECEA